MKSEVKNLACPQLLVGHDTNDDAAVYDVGNGVGIVSTTDFFTPIVDDPTQFGIIAGTLERCVLSYCSDKVVVSFGGLNICFIVCV